MRTSSPRLILLCLAVAVAGSPVAAPAQDTNMAALGALSRFESETVWVRGGTGAELKGRLIRASDDQLVIRVGGDSRTIPAAEIETVEVSRGRAKRGALIGALIGSPLAIVGSAIADRPTGGWRVVGMVVGIAAYAGIGAAIGAVIRHRVVVYSRRSSPFDPPLVAEEFARRAVGRQRREPDDCFRSLLDAPRRAPATHSRPHPSRINAVHKHAALSRLGGE